VQHEHIKEDHKLVGSRVWALGRDLALRLTILCYLMSICTPHVWSLEAHCEKVTQVDVGQRAPHSGVATTANFLRWLGAMRPPRQEEVAYRAGRWVLLLTWTQDPGPSRWHGHRGVDLVPP
jgi:hypothetical protein